MSRTPPDRRRPSPGAASGRDRGGTSSSEATGDRRPISLRTIGVALIVLIAGLSGVGGTYALWSDSATVDLGGVETATASLSADWDPEVEETAWHDLLPGEHAQQALTVTNTGDVSMELSASLETAQAGLDVRVQGTGNGSRLTAAALTTSPAAVPGPSGAAIVIDPGATASLTVEAEATEHLAPGGTTDLSLILEGAQTR